MTTTNTESRITMNTRTITLAADQWEAILDAVECHCDEGPPGEGWKSASLSTASAALSTALAQPEPEGPTDSEVLTDEAIEELTWRHTCEIGDLGVGIAVEDAPAFIRAALARWGRPAIEPVPASERPWEREGWCDAEGRCWFGAPQDGPADAGWILRMPSERLSHQTVSLPHHALPLPQP